MKLSVLLCCLLIAYCYGKSISDSAKIGTTTCAAVDYDHNTVGYNQYITNSLRSQVCAKRIFLYNAKGRIPEAFLGEEHNIVSKQNPCAVVCRYDSTTESVIDQHAKLDTSTHLESQPKESLYTLEEYGALSEAIFRIGANVACGPQHACDSNGCCVKAEQVESEPQQPVTTVVQTTNTLINIENLIQCTSEGYFRNEYDCNRFYRCYHNDETERSAMPLRIAHFVCQEGMVFDTVEHVCVLPHMTAQACNNKVIPQDPIPPPQYENMMSCTSEGYFRNPYDCNLFYRCYYNDETERMQRTIRMANFKCPEGLVFDNTERVCVLPQNSKDVCSNKVVTQDPVAPPQYENNIKCSHEGYYRDPFNCNEFYRCYYNDETERNAGEIRKANFKCHDGMVFDNTAHVCVLPADTKDTCSNQKVPQEPVSPPQYENMLQCTHEGYYRNPYDCNSFYRCYYNDNTERMAGLIHMANFKCSEGLVFDPKEHVCVTPAMTSQTCQNKVVTQDPVAPPQYENMMKCTHEGYFRNPYDCNKFYRCYYNDQSERSTGLINMANFKCHDGMVFDTIAHVCVLPEASAESCSNQPVTQEPVSPPVYENLLKCTREGYFRNPYDCNRFFRCYYNDETERAANQMHMANFKCQEGMVFDTKDHVCVLPEYTAQACSNEPTNQDPAQPPQYENMIKCTHEGWFRNPYNCHQFYRCYYNDQSERASGQIHTAHFTCAANLVFDTVHHTCVNVQAGVQACNNQPVTQEPTKEPEYVNMLKCTQEGYFRNPYDCNKFFRCYSNDDIERRFGIIHMANFKCQDGMVFDNKEQVCVLPEASAACSNQQVTQEPTLPPNYENMMTCYQEGFSRNPYDCNRFTRCYYNDESERNAGVMRMAHFKCAEGLVFVCSQGVCMRPESTTQTCSNQPITQEPSQPPNYENMLKCTHEGYFRDPYDCNKFIRCYSNDETERSAGVMHMANFKCQDGLVFDNSVKVCVKPENAVEVCHNKAVTQYPTTPPVYENMIKCTHEGWFRNPYDCNKFFRCYYNDQTERNAGEIRIANFNCQDGMVFDPKDHVCVLPENTVQSCSNQPITQEPTAPPQYENMLPECTHEGWFRNPYDCSKFYRCYSNDQTERSAGVINMANFQCQSGLVFDTRDHVCVLPENTVQACSNLPVTQDPVAPPYITRPYYDNLLECQAEGYHRNPYDCNKFFRCYYNDESERLSGELRLANFKCSDDLVFDNSERVCVRKADTKQACSNIALTQEPAEPVSYELVCTHEGYFRNPYDCNRFYRCYFNDQTERSANKINIANFKCQDNMVFDTINHVCVLPHNAEACNNKQAPDGFTIV